MDNMPKITIVTPVYNLIKSNRLEFIKQNIESIHNQTYSNLEHIIQDGASDDGTLDFLREFSDKGWIKLYTEKDLNVHDAINKAIKKAEGEFIGILGSDDYYKHNNIIEYIVENYLQNSDIDYVYGDEEKISAADGSYIRTWKGNEYEFEFWRGVPYATEAILFSKKMFNEVGGFDLNYPVCADLKLQMQFKFNDYKGIYCDRVIDCFREGVGLSSNPDTLFLHTKEFSEICSLLWSEFEEDITPEKAEYMIKHDSFEEIFLMKLRRFIINKKLKNIDYIAFNKYIENMINIRKPVIEPVIEPFVPEVKTSFYTNLSLYPFRKMPFIKIVEKDNCKKFYIFGCIPVLKITKEEKGE